MRTVLGGLFLHLREFDAVMSLTFTAPCVVTRPAAGGRIDTCTWLSNASWKTRSIRRAAITTRCCATIGDGTDKSEERLSKQKMDEEQPLDEAAMRAAEIHEVLTGLRDFKNRIIEGKLEH